MTLYIKQKVFALVDSYSIFDRCNSPVFNVKKQFFSFPPKFFIYDHNGIELMRLEKNFTLFLASYEIYQGERHLASVQKELSFLKSKFSIKSGFGSYTIDGEIFDYDFSISKDGYLIGRVHKELLSWGDSYVLDIEDNQSAEFFCALVIAIDNCIHNQNS